MFRPHQIPVLILFFRRLTEWLLGDVAIARLQYSLQMSPVLQTMPVLQAVPVGGGLRSHGLAQPSCRKQMGIDWMTTRLDSVSFDCAASAAMPRHGGVMPATRLTPPGWA
jgi:hypothetical protein